MRALLLPVMLAAVLTACGEARAPGDEAAAAVPEQLIGQFKAASEDVRTLTGNVGVERAGLIFSSGAVLYTRTLDPRRGSDLTAQNGDSYAAIALGASDLHVELRRVLSTANADAICASGAPTYVALVYEDRPAEFTLLVFTGEEAPGPRATQSMLCASYAYVAPHGARTREGVVLW